ncbi:YggT family protein [Aerococcus christensenii]|uniref:YGGT family protein n=1 Tax=Aerococcus christensenii TaxID=87541 RepID=A0A0X8F7H1_9LACT|nr:YggT family protein [Aerococcus christensenii]AMB91980.1 hypothetical protein AWM71_00830 [Aerococcus christensenii]KXB36463.1 YGGT family protein [Aerococcus christensenii]MDK8234438.1 YggT family protein [Aerococcus christensenii]PKY91189.1 YggT family protein [Aerococcus christensenii]WEB70502.1 YggT family protein [Aerococcus christensenii]
MILIFKTLYFLLQTYSFLIVIWALMSWLPNGRESQFGKYLNRIVLPYIEIFDRFIPTLAGISFSPLIAILVLELAMRGLTSLFLVFL